MIIHYGKGRCYFHSNTWTIRVVYNAKFMKETWNSKPKIHNQILLEVNRGTIILIQKDFAKDCIGLQTSNKYKSIAGIFLYNPMIFWTKLSIFQKLEYENSHMRIKRSLNGQALHCFHPLAKSVYIGLTVSLKLWRNLCPARWLKPPKYHAPRALNWIGAKYWICLEIEAQVILILCFLFQDLYMQ